MNLCFENENQNYYDIVHWTSSRSVEVIDVAEIIQKRTVQDSEQCHCWNRCFVPVSPHHDGQRCLLKEFEFDDQISNFPHNRQKSCPTTHFHCQSEHSCHPTSLNKQSSSSTYNFDDRFIIDSDKMINIRHNNNQNSTVSIKKLTDAVVVKAVQCGFVAFAEFAILHFLLFSVANNNTVECYCYEKNDNVDDGQTTTWYHQHSENMELSLITNHEKKKQFDKTSEYPLPCGFLAFAEFYLNIDTNNPLLITTRELTSLWEYAESDDDDEVVTLIEEEMEWESMYVEIVKWLENKVDAMVIYQALIGSSFWIDRNSYNAFNETE